MTQVIDEITLGRRLLRIGSEPDTTGPGVGRLHICGKAPTWLDAMDPREHYSLALEIIQQHSDDFCARMRLGDRVKLTWRDQLNIRPQARLRVPPLT